MRILIIDDHPDFRTLLRHHITSEWPHATIREMDPCVGSVPDITVDPDAHDLVLLDHQLGKFDGMKLLKDFRAQANFPPIIFLTAFGDERLAVRAIKNGANDYIPKTKLTNTLLITTIRESLRGTEASVVPANHFANRSAGGSAVGVLIKGYEVTKKIASGAGSAVYRAFSNTRNEDVVLKVLYGLFELSDEHETLERFLIEYQSVSAIKHPNIVNIFDVGVADDHAFIAMEYLAGGSLLSKLRKHGHLPPAECFDIGVQILKALHAIHGVGILHRDLKPGNVMFRDNGQLCIIDFGLAKQLQIEHDITQPGKIYGTPYYMSPEQGQGLDIDERSDFYSLGAVLFELLSGQKPYVAGTPVALIFKHAHAKIPQLPEYLNKYQFLIDNLMAKNRTDRPDSIQHISDLLKQCETL